MPNRTAMAGVALLVFAAMAVVAVGCSSRQEFSRGSTPTSQASASASREATPSVAAPSPSPTIAGQSATTDEQLADALEAAAAALPSDLLHGNKLGSDDAPLKMLTFVDFQCPYCLKFAATQEPTLIEEYVKTGKLQIIAQMYPILGPESVLAAVGGECAAAQDKFWEYYDRLYLVQAQAGQVSNERQNVGRFSRDNLVAYATDLGMDGTAFNTCIADPATVAAVQTSVNAARDFGITGTPGFVINGVSHGSGAPSSLDAWRNILETALTQTPTASPAATGGSV